MPVIDEEQLVSDLVYEINFISKIYAEICEIKFILQDIRDELLGEIKKE